MDKLIVNTSSTEQWSSLVKDASSQCCIDLTENVESYLVFLLIRYTDHEKLLNKIIAIDYLEATQSQPGKSQQSSLKEVGDSCLLISGLFPGKAKQCRVNLEYYINIGQSAYSYLSNLPCQNDKNSFALYQELCQSFIDMVDTLQTMHQLNLSASPTLSPIDANELYHNTGSQSALNLLKRYTNQENLITHPGSNTKH